MAPVTGRGLARFLDFWGRRVHIYVGLYFTLSLWFFSLSGLALNRPEWFMGEEGPSRAESTEQVAILAPQDTSAAGMAAELKSQLEIQGELDRFWLDPEGKKFWFRVTRPGLMTNVDVRLDSLNAKVRVTDWGPLVTANTLHTFTGVGPWRDRGRREPLARDWLATTVWVLSMDALCVGLLYMVASGIYLWLRQPEKRATGAVFLGVGLVACLFFVFGMG